MFNDVTMFNRQEFNISLKRSFPLNYPEKSPLWNFIYAAANFADPRISQVLEDAVWTLENWPLSWIDWNVQNSHRLDFFLDPEQNRDGESMKSLKLFPYDERSMFRWNSDPFTLDEGSGKSECDMTAFLLPYWLGRYYGFLKR